MVVTGDISIALIDERGKDVPVKTIDNKDGTFTIEYEPKTPGTYTVAVYFANSEIPKSPIKVTVEASVDLSKVKVVGLDTRKCVDFDTVLVIGFEVIGWALGLLWWEICVHFCR